MALSPFRVRLTADGAGTLDAVHATIELVDQAELLAPWAWFRGDNVETSGSSVTGRLDIAGGCGTLPLTAGTPQVATGLNGQQAVSYADSSEFIRTSTDSPSGAAGITVAIVHAGLPANSFFQVTMRREDVFDDQSIEVSSNYLDGYTSTVGTYLTGTIDATVPQLLVVRLRDGAADCHINNVEVLSATGNFDPANIIRVELFAGIFSDSPGFNELETAIFDQALDQAGMDTWWSYAQARYGL